MAGAQIRTMVIRRGIAIVPLCCRIGPVSPLVARRAPVRSVTVVCPCMIKHAEKVNDRNPRTKNGKGSIEDG